MYIYDTDNTDLCIYLHVYVCVCVCVCVYRKITSKVVLVVKGSSDIAGDIRDTSSIPGLGRSPGGGHGNPLQYSDL